MSFAFNFEPMSDEDLNRAFILPPGTYEFAVHDFQMRTSKANNPMIELHIRILDGNVTHTIFDYLVNTLKAQYKIKNFCYAVGKEDEYNAGHLTPDRSWLGLRGQCKIDIKVGIPKDDGSGEMWPDRNVIADYIRKEKAETEIRNKPERLILPKEEMPELNDDIPF